jgi:pyridoxal phosphate enzyme (YggS family)
MSLAEALTAVKDRIAAAAKQAGRDPEDVELIVVTKTHTAQLVIDLIGLGQINFGENKDQEASAKAMEVASVLPAANPIWHFVGQLQSNKVKSMLNYASVLHSLDRKSLLNELAKQLGNRPGAALDVFIELNLTNDPGRGGVEPKNLLAFADEVLQVPQINLLGVMGVAGLEADPNAEFERVSEASQELQRISPKSSFISAGMSGDFELAIAHGATHIRVGTAITGNR